MPEDASSNQERTERPTARRREQARTDGRVARSTDLSAVAVLLAGAAALAASGPTLGGMLTGVVRQSTTAMGSSLTAAGAAGLMRGVGLRAMGALLPLVLTLMAAAVLVNALQARGALSWTPLAPDVSRVSPLAGLKRLLGLDGLFGLIQSLLKIAVLSVVTYTVLKRAWPDLSALAAMGPGGVAGELRSVLLRLLVVVGLAMLVVAAVDYGFQLFRMERSLRMTRQDVVREQRETEGDPLVKARLQSVARARARQRMFQQVPTADGKAVNELVRAKLGGA